MENLSISNVETILVVEDEPNIVKLCCKALNDGGLGVDIAINGRVAQGMVGEKSYALYLIDIRTPEMNGIELFQWMGEEYPEIVERVIFTTGDIIGMETVDFIEQSGLPFLPKPFTPAQLRSTVNGALKHTRKLDLGIRRYADFDYPRVSRYGLEMAGVLCNRVP